MRTKPLRSIGLSVFLLICHFFSGPSGQAAGQATSQADRDHSWKRHLEMTETSVFKGLRWKAVGPKFAGGRVETIDCPGGISTTMYVGFGAGNLWKTTNNGTTWKPIFENAPTFAIGDIAVAPSAPDVLWLGTEPKQGVPFEES